MNLARIHSLQTPQKKQDQKENTKEKEDGGKTPKASDAERVAWCVDVMGDSHSMSTQTTHQKNDHSANQPCRSCVGRLSEQGGCRWDKSNQGVLC